MGGGHYGWPSEVILELLFLSLFAFLCGRFRGYGQDVTRNYADKYWTVV